MTISPNMKKISESGNAVIIVLIALVIVAVGAMAYLSGQMAGEQIQEQTETAAGPESPADDSMNPVVAKVNGEDIHRQDVFQIMGVLSENVRGSVPADQLYVMALEQAINTRIIEEKVEDSSIGRDAEVKKQLEEAREQIERAVFLQKEAQSRITDEKLQAAYQTYKENFPQVEEVNAKQILLSDEAKAKELIRKLDEGAAFEELAEANSIAQSPLPGGELGYFTKQEVVPEFGAAAFKMEPGTYTKTPVKSKFGYHIIKVLDKRQRPPQDFEQAKPFLEANLRRQALDEAIREWREKADIVRFDVNGKPLEPAAGGTDAKIVPTVESAKQDNADAAEEKPAEEPQPEAEAQPEAEETPAEEEAPAEEESVEEESAE